MEKVQLKVKDKPIEPLRKGKSLLITPKRIALFIFVLFLILVGIYFWREICFLIKAPKLEVSQPSIDITVNQENFQVIGKTDPSAYLIVNGKEVYIDKEGNFTIEIALSLGVNIVKAEAKNRFNKSNIIIRRIIYEKE
jgi:hypothetical protein